MPEVFIQGGEGKLQAKYSPSEEEKPNIAIVLHPNPKPVSYTHLTLPTSCCV